MNKKRQKKRRILVLIGGVFLIFIVGGMIMFWKQGQEMKSSNHPKQSEPNQEDKTNQTNASLEKAPVSYLEFQNLEDGEYITEKGYTLNVKNGIASIEGHLIVNKTYAVPETFQPENPAEKVTGERCNSCIDKETLEAFRLMQSDATSLGLNIYIASGYRSYTYQDRLYNNYSAVSGMEGADTYSARPGHSEHQTGLCFDLNSIDDSFANTDEGKWVHDHAHLYGFIIRYPKGKESITGYQYESWHLRYVGKELANKLYQDGDWITLEEYYGISSSYQT